MTQIVQWGERDPNLSLIGVIQLDTNTRQIVNVYQHLTTVGVCTISHVGTEKQEFKWGATCFIRDSLEAINTFWATVGCICYTPANINHFLPNEDGTWPFTLPGSIHYGFDISEAHPCHLSFSIPSRPYSVMNDGGALCKTMSPLSSTSTPYLRSF